MTVTLTPFNANTQYFADLFTLVNQLVSVTANNTITANSSANGSASVGNCYVLGILAASNLAANTIGGGNVQSASPLTVTSNLVMNTTFSFVSGVVVVNATTLAVGSNLVMNTSVLSIGNSSSNVQVNSTTITVPLILGSPTVNNNIQVNNNANVANTLSVGSNVVINTSSIVVGTNFVTSVNTTTTGTGTQVVDSWLLNTYRSAEYHLTVKDNIANNYQVSKILMLQDGTNAYITEFSILSSNSAMGSFTASAGGGSATLSFTPISANTTIKGVHFGVSV